MKLLKSLPLTLILLFALNASAQNTPWPSLFLGGANSGWAGLGTGLFGSPGLLDLLHIHGKVGVTPYDHPALRISLSGDQSDLYWGQLAIETGAMHYSATTSLGDFVLRASPQANDLVLCTGNPNAAIRFTTTPPGLALPDQERMRIYPNGNVRIGSPQYANRKLNLGGDLFMDEGGVALNKIRWDEWGDARTHWIGYESVPGRSSNWWMTFSAHTAEGFIFKCGPTQPSEGTGIEVMKIMNLSSAALDPDEQSIPNEWQGKVLVNGRVYIGTKNPGLTPTGTHFALAVNGSVKARELIVDIHDWSNWPDYVFGEQYQLPLLSDIEDFVKREHHLPGIPSAKEIGNKGLAIGELTQSLLQKIEELTLHSIEQEKRLSTSLEFAARLENRLKQLESSLSGGSNR